MSTEKHQAKQPLLHATSASPEARAARLRRLRNLANLSRREVCERADIKLDTLIGWEVARHGGLTEKGAKTILSCIANEGVQCTLEWLLYDTGIGPALLPNFDKAKANLQKTAETTADTTNEEKLIIEELLLFREHYLDAIDCIVQDDAMLPHYSPNDYVAGIKRYKNDIAKLEGHHCIVQLVDGNTLVRCLRKGQDKGKYTLLSININATSTTTLIIPEVELACAAPIIWLRRKNHDL